MVPIISFNFLIILREKGRGHHACAKGSDGGYIEIMLSIVLGMNSPLPHDYTIEDIVSNYERPNPV